MQPPPLFRLRRHPSLVDSLLNTEAMLCRALCATVRMRAAIGLVPIITAITASRRAPRRLLSDRGDRTISHRSDEASSFLGVPGPSSAGVRNVSERRRDASRFLATVDVEQRTGIDRFGGELDGERALDHAGD